MTIEDEQDVSGVEVVPGLSEDDGLRILPIRRLDKPLTNAVAAVIRKNMSRLERAGKTVDAIDVPDDPDDNVFLVVSELPLSTSGNDVAQTEIRAALERIDAAYSRNEIPPIVGTVLNQASQMLLHALDVLEAGDIAGDDAVHEIVSTVHQALERLPVGDVSIRFRIVKKLLRATYVIKAAPERRQSLVQHLVTMIPQVAGKSLTLEESDLSAVFDAPTEGRRRQAINRVLLRFKLLVGEDTLERYMQRCRRELVPSKDEEQAT